MNRKIKKQNWIEENVRFPYCMGFEVVYAWFKNQLKNYEPGTILIADFNGVTLNSNMTKDELWIAYWGKTEEEVLAEREKNIKEAAEEYKKSQKELEDYRKKYEQWEIETYGSHEAHKQKIIEDLCQAVDNLIPEERKDDWRITVTKNYNRPEVREVLHYLKRLNEVKNPESIFGELKEYMMNQNHSGTTANWVLSCIEHYGGDIGKQLVQYMKEYE